MNDAIRSGEQHARRVESETAQGNGAGGFGRGRRAAQHGAQAQDQLARLERLAEIIVGARFESTDAILRRAAGRQQQHRHGVAPGAQGFGECEAALARHRHVEHDRIRLHDAQLGAGILGVIGGGDAEALLGEVPAQQGAQPRIVVHHKNMRGVTAGHRAGRPGVRDKRARRAPRSRGAPGGIHRPPGRPLPERP